MQFNIFLIVLSLLFIGFRTDLQAQKADCKAELEKMEKLILSVEEKQASLTKLYEAALQNISQENDNKEEDYSMESSIIQVFKDIPSVLIDSKGKVVSKHLPDGLRKREQQKEIKRLQGLYPPIQIDVFGEIQLVYHGDMPLLQDLREIYSSLKQICD